MPVVEMQSTHAATAQDAEGEGKHRPALSPSSIFHYTNPPSETVPSVPSNTLDWFNQKWLADSSEGWRGENARSTPEPELRHVGVSIASTLQYSAGEIRGSSRVGTLPQVPS